MQLDNYSIGVDFLLNKRGLKQASRSLADLSKRNANIDLRVLLDSRSFRKVRNELTRSSATAIKVTPQLTKRKMVVGLTANPRDVRTINSFFAKKRTINYGIKGELRNVRIRVNSSEVQAAKSKLDQLRRQIASINRLSANVNVNGPTAVAGGGAGAAAAGAAALSKGAYVAASGGMTLAQAAPVALLGGAAVAGVAATVALKRTVKTAADLETGLANVRKTTNLSNGEYMLLLDNLLKASTTDVVVNPLRLLEYAAAAGTMGFKTREAIEEVATTMGMLEKATNLSGTGAVLALGRINDLTGGTNEDFGKLASVINVLGNNFKTTEAAIVHTAVGIAQATTNFNVPTHQVAALAAAYDATGVTAENARSATLRVLSTFRDANAGNAAFLRTIATVTQQTTAQVKEAYSKDKVQLMLNFAKGLSESEKRGFSLTTVMKELKLEGVQLKTVFPTVGKTAKIYQEAIRLSNEEVLRGTSLQEENAKSNETANTSFQRMDNSILALQNQVASGGLLEGLADLTDGLASLAGSVGNAYVQIKLAASNAIGRAKLRENKNALVRRRIKEYGSVGYLQKLNSGYFGSKKESAYFATKKRKLVAANRANNAPPISIRQVITGVAGTPKSIEKATHMGVRKAISTAAKASIGGL